MRKLVLAAACAAVALSPACVSVKPASSVPRMVILGIDGMDPDLARDWMREGRLPNLASLAARGGFAPLETIPAPQCEAAWSSFAAGRAVPAPVVTHHPAELLLNFVTVARERWTTTREDPSFWSRAGAAGVRSRIIAVPGSFPPEEVPNGELFAGSPLPDVGRRGAYQLFSTTVSEDDEGASANGGRWSRLRFAQREAHGEILGPLHPVSREQLTLPFTITWNHESRSANVQVGPHLVHVREHEWTRWLVLDFRVNAITRVRGAAQLFLVRAGTDLELYVSPIHWHPSEPPAPITAPPPLARELFDQLGLFRTWGWNAATAALADERLDEAAFLDDAERAFQDRAETILNRLDAGDWDLFVGVVDTTDRVQHMMWRLRDPQHPRYDAELARRYGSSIAQSYQQADELLGDIIARIPKDTVVLVVSDHGFHTVRTSSKWSGDHTDTDPSRIAGLLVASVPLTSQTPRLIDVGASVLKHFGVVP